MPTFDHNAEVTMARPVPPPVVRPEAARLLGPSVCLRREVRAVWAAVGMICCIVLGTALFLKPDVRGFGTHEALGMDPCGFVFMTGLPCPTCGMTTSFAHLVRGHVFASIKAQPAGFVLCVATAVLMFVAMSAAIRGRIVTINWERIGAVRLGLTVGFVLVGGWAVKLLIGFATGAYPLR